MLELGQEVTQAAQAEMQKAAILVPAPVQAQLPEDTAWSMIYAEVGVVGVMLAIAVVTLWKIGAKVFQETREQNAALVQKQAEAISSLKESLSDVKVAIQVSDSNNQTALRHLGETVSAAVARLDRHEEKLGTYGEKLVETHHRLTYLERGAGPAASGVRPLDRDGRSIT